MYRFHLPHKNQSNYKIYCFRLPGWVYIQISIYKYDVLLTNVSHA